jgi:biotin carboxylase
MNKKLMVVGCGLSQIPTFESAKKNNIKTIGVDGSPNAPYKDMADIFEVADIKNINDVLQVARKHTIDGIVVPGTDFPLTGAYVADKMGLPGISIETARICENKYLQRKKLKDNGFYVPESILLNHNIINLLRHKIHENFLKGKCIIKPIDNMAARGVIAFDIDKVSDTELKDITDEALFYSRSKKYIIEEFIEGMEFSVDSLVCGGEVFIFAFADRHFSLYPYMIEIGHTMPSVISKKIREEIGNEFIRAVKVLGIDNGAAKGDIKLTKNGIMIGEIAARISGGYLSGWTTPLTCGYYPHDDLIKISLGEKPMFPSLKYEGYSAERVFLSIPGIVKEYITTKKTKCLKEMKLYHKIGEEINYPYHNAYRAGSAITYSKKGRDEAIFFAEDAVKNTVIRLQPNVKSTTDFLLSDNKLDRIFKPAKKEVDWEGRDLEFALRQIKAITGIKSFSGLSENFWKSFYKGGVQGGTYYIDTFLK